MKKLLFVVDTDWFFISHRLALAVAAKEEGYTVVVVAYDTGKADLIREKGIKFIHAEVVRKGLNPLKELTIARALYRIYKAERPDIVHHITLKMIISGSLVSRFAGVKSIVNAVTGLGHFFIDPKKEWMVNLLFSPIFKMISKSPGLKYIFQNRDDQDVFMFRGWADKDSSVLINGSGVDLEEYKYMPEPDTLRIKVSCGTRLLRDKGIYEFAEASRLLSKRYSGRIECILAGRIITENPTSISLREINDWVQEGILSYSGFQTDMYDFLGNCHINVLPSYREGLPRSLIEACAVGRPIVTTDVPGCREVVSDGINGFLVPARDGKKLAEAIAMLIDDKELRERMGRASRRKAEKEFDLKIVIHDTLKAYDSFNQ
jgi:glycosyltransferase involved in cell wall biosynthesis